MRAPVRKPRRDQRGAVLIWVALFLMVMLGFIALGIDVAKLMVTRTQLQNAADAAALAGASAIDRNTGELIEAEARVRACATALQNRAYENTVTPIVIDPAGDVVVDLANKTVTVTARRERSNGAPMIAHFAQVLSPVLGRMDMRATATAKVDYANSACLKAVPLAAVPPDTAQTFVTGREYTLKLGGGSGSGGNYLALDFPGCDEPNAPCAGMNPTGANIFRCLIENGYACCVTVEQRLTTEPGNMAGPFRQAMNSRFDSDTDRREGISYAEYNGNQSRVVLVPITTRPTSGRNYVDVIRFGSFFVKYRVAGGNSPEWRGEFINDIVPGTGNGPGGSTTFALRLIR